tara:strand:+ start:1321 stop:1506 length:186 start_codon:yes stop_codon:yes gene_type:complete
MTKTINIKHSTLEKMIKQLRKENSEFYDLLQLMKSKVNKLEQENAKLKKEYEMLEEDYNQQ